METIAKSWLALQCQMIPGVVSALVRLDLFAGDQQQSAAPLATWPDDRIDTTLLTQASCNAVSAGKPLVECFDSTNTTGNAEWGQTASDGPHQVVACPLKVGDTIQGVVAIELRALDEAQQHAVIQLLGWGSAWLELLLRTNDGAAAVARLTALTGLLASSVEKPGFQFSSLSLLNELATQLSCDRVSLGLKQAQRVRVVAISNTSSVDRRSKLVQAIGRAMEEAVDQAAPIAFSQDASSHYAHRQLAKEQHLSHLCSIPYWLDDNVAGVMSFERSRGAAFNAEEIEFCDAVASLAGPVLQLKYSEQRWIGTKVAAATRAAAAKLIGPERIASKLVALLILGAIIAGASLDGQHRVAADAMIEGRTQRALVAGIDGFVKDSHVRAGNIVRGGKLIAELDDRPFRLEQHRLASEQSELETKHQRAIAKLERAEAKILEASIRKVQTRLALLEQELARTQIRAPFDGMIVTGDLSHSLGAPVQRGQVLFEVAPLDDYRVSLLVDESEIGAIRAGQRGKLALAAIPEQPLAFEIERVIGIARTDEGRNGFEVEARLADSQSVIRPGMKGVGKIEVESRSLLWIWTHSIFERAQLWLWRYWP